jgi:hypothetical protein
MNNNDFKAFIEDESWEINKKTIEVMMEKELEKEVQEINIDFVDACMNYLAGYSIVDTPKEKAYKIQQDNNCCNYSCFFNFNWYDSICKSK